eukprot:gene5658-9474_t
MKVFSFVLVFIFLVAFISAEPAPLWSRIGHELVAHIAQSMVTGDANKAIKRLFPRGTLASESMWADQVKRDPKWKFSGPYHFANFPGNSCDYQPARDCNPPRSCVVNAIFNYTSQLKSADFEKAKTALRFVTHLVGDLHQPLHIGRASDYGGNSIEVTYMNRKTNLHSVWDGSLLYTKAERNFGRDERRYLGDFLNRLKSEPWRSKMKEWMSCRGGINQCPIQWANENAKISCKDAYGNVRNGDVLADAYYTEKIGIAEEMIARGGVRLALILNHVWP